MILVVDNYDSFVHNLARYLREAGEETLIIRNDAIGVGEALALAPRAVVLSPGPKRPADAGVCLPLLKALPDDVPVLGVCLGHQCLVEAFGGGIRRAAEPVHGEARPIYHDGEGVFTGIRSPMAAGRYHSLVGDLGAGDELIAAARSDRGELMAARRRRAPWHGVQFHPESVLTPDGKRLIGNFVHIVRTGRAS
jgi:anthranilate synthase/aminodeoxychorismate synthase-like glutamine amidotransferase